jgi:hypothetical protein
MGNNLGPFGLSRGCKVIYRATDAEHRASLIVTKYANR